MKTYQNRKQKEVMEQKGLVKLGPNASYIWRDDPRHLAFIFSRYKFCSKLLEGKESVLEIGCGDGLGIPLLLQTVGRLHAVDFEDELIEGLQKEYSDNKRVSLSVLDITRENPKQKFDAACSLDVIEHIDRKKEKDFIQNIVKSLKKNAVCIIGTPNVTASQFASKLSKEDHINLKSHEELRGLLGQYFENVFLFSMNDEVVHTGFYPMAHYLFGIGAGLKGGNS